MGTLWCSPTTREQSKDTEDVATASPWTLWAVDSSSRVAQVPFHTRAFPAPPLDVDTHLGGRGPGVSMANALPQGRPAHSRGCRPGPHSLGLGAHRQRNRASTGRAQRGRRVSGKWGKDGPGNSEMEQRAQGENGRGNPGRRSLSDGPSTASSGLGGSAGRGAGGDGAGGEEAAGACRVLRGLWSSQRLTCESLCNGKKRESVNWTFVSSHQVQGQTYTS